LRRIAEAGRKAGGYVRLRRLLAGSEPPYRVELGSGLVRREGWVNTDVWSRAPYHLDATRRWPFPDGSVSHVYGDNMIEHVPLEGARALFGHALRALRPGGCIRLVTPDARKCAEIYLAGGDQARELADAHRGAGTRMEHDVDLLRATFIEYEHDRGYAWDLAALRVELGRAGFESVERVSLGESDYPVFRGLESRVLPIDRVAMLAVEARRPG
jgi:predicted SAM-dependent methyltransferase